MKPADVELEIYINFTVDFATKNPQFEVVGHVPISKCKNILKELYSKLARKRSCD